MSIQTELDRISAAVGNAHKKVKEKGGTTAEPYLVGNLEAAIDSIPTGPTSDKVASFDGDSTGMTWYADNDNDIAFGSSYPNGEQWLRIDDAWTKDELLGATVVTKDSSGEHTYTITEDMLNVIEYEDATIIRVGITLFGDNDLVSLHFFNEDGWIPSGLYHCADWPITVTKKGAGAAPAAVYIGTAAPSADVGADGDIFIVRSETA